MQGYEPKMNLTPYENGVRAGKAGEQMFNNPYLTPEDARDFDEGWKDSKKTKTKAIEETTEQKSSRWLPAHPDA